MEVDPAEEPLSSDHVSVRDPLGWALDLSVASLPGQPALRQFYKKPGPFQPDTIGCVESSLPV